MISDNSQTSQMSPVKGGASKGMELVIQNLIDDETIEWLVEKEKPSKKYCDIKDLFNVSVRSETLETQNEIIETLNVQKILENQNTER